MRPRLGRWTPTGRRWSGWCVATATARCGCPTSSCGGSGWRRPAETRCGRRPESSATSRYFSRIWRRWSRSSASRPTCSATTASATTRCSRTTSRACAPPQVEPMFAALTRRALRALGPDPGGGTAAASAVCRTRRSLTTRRCGSAVRLLPDLGYDLEAGRLDLSAHPFSTAIAIRDVRHHDPDVCRRPVPLGDGHDPRGRPRAVRAGHGSRPMRTCR